MARANRYMLTGAACHLTHRCHDRAFLLDLQENHRMAVEAELGRRSTLKREPYWTEAVAVGSPSFVAGMVLNRSWNRKTSGAACPPPQLADDAWILREQAPQLGLYALTSHENRR